MVPDFPAQLILSSLALVLVELTVTPERANLVFGFIDSAMASVSKNAVDSLTTLCVSGVLSIRVFPLWSTIFVKNIGFVYTPLLAIPAKALVSSRFVTPFVRPPSARLAV